MKDENEHKLTTPDAKDGNFGRTTDEGFAIRQLRLLKERLGSKITEDIYAVEAAEIDKMIEEIPGTDKGNAELLSENKRLRELLLKAKNYVSEGADMFADATDAQDLKQEFQSVVREIEAALTQNP